MPSLQDAAIKRVDMYQFDPRMIEVEPGYNLTGRDFDSANDEEDAALKADIRVAGVRTPLVIRSSGNQVLVVQGHRRLAAVKELIAEGLEIKAVPCLPEPKGTSPADRVFDLIRSNSSKKVTVLQYAETLKRLLDFGWSEEEIANKSGRSRSHVSDMLFLLTAGQDVRGLIHDGTVAPTTAVRAMRQEGDNAGTVLTTAAAEAKAAGKSKVSATKALGSRKPGKVTVERAAVASDWDALRQEADGYIAVLERIARMGDGVAQRLAQAALGWEVMEDVA